MPNSSSCRLMGIFVNADSLEFLKVAIVSVPEKGQANKELIDLLHKKLDVAKSFCEIISGGADRYKKIKIYGDASSLESRLEQWMKRDIT